MGSFTLGRLAQIIHVVGELPPADHFYENVFAGRRFYEGYSPFERRDAALLAIGDFVIEPMAPADEPGADQMPVGRFHRRFGNHLHSIAINVEGVEELYEQLRAADVRVVGPGGTDPTEVPSHGVRSIYTHPRDSHGLLEFVDFGDELMPGSPRLAADWDPTPWRDTHPLRLSGCSHVTVVVHDLDAATAFFGGVLGCDVFHERESSLEGTRSRFVLLGTETVVELAQPVQADLAAGVDLAANGEILHSITFRTLDLDRAASWLAEQSVRLVHRSEHTLITHVDDCHGARIMFSDAGIPADPRDS